MKWKTRGDRGLGRRILSDVSLHIAMIVRTIMPSVGCKYICTKLHRDEL
jgi:hypothetical protein